MSILSYINKVKRQLYGSVIMPHICLFICYILCYTAFEGWCNSMSEKKEKVKNEKTIRILTIYHLFRFCEAVSMEEIRNAVGNWTDKTIFRDISILKHAGVPILYSNKRKAYVKNHDKNVDGVNSESRHYLSDVCTKTDGEASNYYKHAQSFFGGVKEKQYIMKIARLITMMSDLPEIDCDVWYRDIFPDVSERTMKRDFAILKNVEAIYHDYRYEIFYKRAWDDPEVKDVYWDSDPPGHYYYEGVHGM